MLTKRVTINSRRLPHWRVDDGTYAVTFHLADSLPAHVVKQISEDSRFLDTDAEGFARKRARLEQLLDAGHGSCLLARPDCAQIVQDVLQKFDGERYRLGTWTIMPNHAHTMVRPLKGNTLDSVVAAWKSVSSHRITAVTGIHRRVWQPEFYDSWLRDDNDVRRVRQYILNNPIKARLDGWKWVGDPDVADLIGPRLIEGSA